MLNLLWKEQGMSSRNSYQTKSSPGYSVNLSEDVAIIFVCFVVHHDYMVCPDCMCP